MPARRWRRISYHVCDPKRLRQLTKQWESYGRRVQHSVFRDRLDTLTQEKLAGNVTEGTIDSQAFHYRCELP